MQALIDNGLVVQVEPTPFPVNPAYVWIDCTAAPNCAPGWTWNGSTFTAPPAILFYNPSIWYWIVGNISAPNNVFSAPAGAYVADTDSGYEAFLTSGGTATDIGTDGELAATLYEAGLPFTTVTACGWTSWGTTPLELVVAVLLYVGVAVESTETPSLNAVYAIDQTSQATLNGLFVGVALGYNFPGGTSNFNYPDINGIPHNFTETNFTNFGIEIRNYVYAVTQIGAGGPVPTTPITIA